MSNLDKIEHIVVLMLENHSFDSLLGYLYENDAPKRFIGDFDGPPRFDGVADKGELSNPDPQGRPILVGKAPSGQRDMCNPFPDPGEEFSPHVNTQLFGQDPPPDPSLPPPMSGFVLDYVKAIEDQLLFKREVTEAEYRIIMNCFTPDAVPVLSGLARSFAVSDRWFSSVPSQTFCNRSFFHSGQSNGFVTNADYVKWLKNEAPTLMNVLTDAGLDWRVYFDPVDVLPLTRAIHPKLFGFSDNFRQFSDFVADCKKPDGLPAYTFIEPRLLVNHNDMHPPVLLNPAIDSSVLAGEVLVNDVYEAIRSSPMWESTLLIITFDEHGGCYDHVPPPRATPPGLATVGPPDAPPGGPFGFDRFGVRVPAIFVSPFIEEGTVIRATGAVPFDHTSLIRTILERWILPRLRDRVAQAQATGDPAAASQAQGELAAAERALGDRAAAAPSLEPLLSRAEARTDRLTLTPRPYVPIPEPMTLLLPLTPHQLEWANTFAAAVEAPFARQVRNVGEVIDHLKTALEAKLKRL